MLTHLLFNVHFNLQLKEVKCAVADDTASCMVHQNIASISFLSEVGKHLSIGKLMTLLGT